MGLKNKQRKQNLYSMCDNFDIHFIEKKVDREEVKEDCPDLPKNKDVVLLIPEITLGDTKFNHYIDLYEVLVRYKNIKYPNYMDDAFAQRYKINLFYPFTCSCGIPECNGYFNGIGIKVKKRTIEWKVNKEDMYMYNHLQKREFRFDRKKYENRVQEIIEELKERSEDKNILYTIDALTFTDLSEELKYWK